MKLTIFTPTYNRGYIIEQLYRSLQRQTCYDFEWLVIDDGSTDNTEELFSMWIEEKNLFPIRYYKKENGGKQRAWNMALELVTGELFFVVDSDDYLVDDAVECIIRQAVSLPSNRKYAGVCNCRSTDSQTILGSTFDGAYLDCTSLERQKYGIEGDKAEVLFTEIAKQYPFPEFEGEKFVTEAVVWDRIAADGYKFRFFNQITYLAEYRADGLTAQGLSLYYQNPRGYALYLKQSRVYGKFSLEVQRYFDMEYYRNLKSTFSSREIADLLGLKVRQLHVQYILYLLRQKVSKVKRKLFK